MLRLSETLLNQPVLSLRTGSLVGKTLGPIINPNNLKIEGFVCQDSLDRQVQLILLCQDIRDIIPQGIVVNDHEVLAHPSELPKLAKIINLNFGLIGKQVGTSSKSNIGKVTNYAVDSSSMFIQKLYVSAPILRNFTGGSMIVDRSQIVEITTKKIIINDLDQRVTVNAAATA